MQILDLIDRFKAEVESSNVLIGAFEICNVVGRKERSIPCEVRAVRLFSVLSQKDETFKF